MGNVVGHRYRYGASFVDQESGVRFEGHHPMERPDLWQVYLDGAEGIYRSRGFEEALRRRDFEDGNGVPLFFLGFAPNGEAVAGVRFHGPLEGSHQAFLIEEMAESSEIDEIASVIDKEVRLGAIESKGAWSKGEAVNGVHLAMTLSRCFIHAMNWLSAEFAIAAVSDRLLPLAEFIGAKMVGTQSVPFPDDRYQTVAVCFRRTLSYELSSPENQLALRLEGEQLSRGPVSIGAQDPQHFADKAVALAQTLRRRAALGLLPVASSGGPAARASRVLRGATRSQPQQGNPRRTGSPAHAVRGRRGGQRGPLDRAHSRDGGIGGRDSIGRLRHP